MKVYITEDDMCTTQKLNLARVQKWIEANGSSVTNVKEEADKVLCMTCNGWSLLEQNSYERIKSLKGDHADKMIVVGCVVDSHPGKVAEIWDGPVVKTAGPHAYSFAEIESYFPDFKIPLRDVPAQSVFRRKEDYREYNLSKRFINIAEGCAFNCTFCTHKPGLGRRRSRPLGEIIEQIEGCVRDGVRVVNLMGMETSLYGMDVGSNYPELLKAVLDYNDSYEIHVAQFNSTGLARYYDQLIPLFQNKRVADVQAPIQSTSARLLKMMNRKDHSEKIGSFVTEMRKKNNRAVLRTDLIIGWPTETEEERLHSLDFAGTHFDEVALYTIELSPDLPAWKYQPDAFSTEQLAEIRSTSADYLRNRFPQLVVHSGQQDDSSMADAERKRIALRQRRLAS
jgi:tRNA A37 methylthiotransferase MiaB